MPPTISRRGVVLLAIAGATALLLATLGVTDWWMRNAELRTLLGRVERAERAQRPAAGISTLVNLCRDDPTGAAGGCDTVTIRLVAERTLPTLRRTGDEVAATRLTSFHGSLQTFRDRYVDHYMAWRTWLEALAEDPTATGFAAPASITSTFENASDAADDALTPLPLYGNDDRIEAIFESVR